MMPNWRIRISNGALPLGKPNSNEELLHLLSKEAKLVQPKILRQPNIHHPVFS